MKALLILKILLFSMALLLLSIISQIGGVILLLCIPVFIFLNKKIKKKKLLFLSKILSYFLIYLIFTFAIIPPIAKLFNRMPLPVFSDKNIKPSNILTCVLNRHYVRTELKENIEAISIELNKKYPNTVISYLDANFPFINGFPMLPHLSHNDGKKLDLAFFYSDAITKEKLANPSTSFMGYGFCEEASQNEINTCKECIDKGYKQYNYIKFISSERNKDKMIFDQERTKFLLQLLSKNETIGKIFIEPHLKNRMKLNSSKIRFQGCHSVRHDDHIHLQLF